MIEHILPICLSNPNVHICKSLDSLDNLFWLTLLLPAKLETLLTKVVPLTFVCSCSHGYKDHTDMCGSMLCNKCITGGKYFTFRFRNAIGICVGNKH